MIVDLQARNEALDPERSFIVQAPAGSGKTGLLVYRYLTLLARVEKPQNVLAITFTRKARSEMRERISELLLAAKEGAVNDNAFEQQGLSLAKQVLQRDEQAGWQLLDAPHQMQVLTIDAFSAKLAASMPWLSRLGERPNTTDMAHAHFAFAVDQVLDELLVEGSDLSAALQMVMFELDFNYDKARRLFSSMLAKRDQWLRHLVQQDMMQMKYDLEEAWSQLLRENLDTVETLFSRNQFEQLLELVVGASQRIDYENPRALQCLRVFVGFNASTDELSHAHWRALIDFVLVKKHDKVRAAVNKNLGFPVKGQDKDNCVELFKELSEDFSLITALAELAELPTPAFSDYDWQRLVALEKVLKALAVRLQLRFRSVGECDHSEVTQRANLALTELNNPTDLGLLMDGQVHHILVDEFQDTSNSQLDLLKKLTAGWQVNDNPQRTLFLVGDPMQSIYRFREADVGLFLQVVNNEQTNVFDNILVSSLTLSQNFRSSDDLVDWFNRTFQPSFPRQNNVLSGAISYAPAASAKVGVAEEPVSYYLANSRAQEAEALLQAVQSALKELPDSTSQIAILVRTRPQLDYLLPILDENGIAYAAVDIQPLHEQQSIKDVVSLAKAICREDDKLAWLAILRGPWCGLSLAEIHIVNRSSNVSLWQALNDASIQNKLDVNTQARLSRLLQVMQAVRQQHQQVNLGSLTRWAWQQLGGEATLGSTHCDDVEQVFELLNDLQRGGDLPNTKELEAGLERMRSRSNGPAQPRVVVSTIHKSKGLQYHTVILPGLANRPRSDDREILMWAEHQTQDGNANLLLAPLMFNSGSRNEGEVSHYDYLRGLDAKRATNEVMRLMYVACTRAEHKLVLIANIKLREKDGQKTGEVNPPIKTSLLASVWPTLEAHFELMPSDQTELGLIESSLVEPGLVEPDLVKRGLAEQQLDQTLYRLPVDFKVESGDDFTWQALDQLNKADLPSPDEQVTFDWATEVAAAVGMVLHDFLQFSSDSVLNVDINQMLRKRWRAELAALRVPDNRIEYALRRLVMAIENIQSDEQAKFIFSDHALAQNEYAISTLENGRVKSYRLDRTFVDEGVRWIVDYKSTMTQGADIESFVDSQIDERHRSQLEKYGELMSEIDTRPIKLAVYFPLLKQMRCWDYQPR